jgi:hypothetical protein
MTTASAHDNRVFVIARTSNLGIWTFSLTPSGRYSKDAHSIAPILDSSESVDNPLGKLVQDLDPARRSDDDIAASDDRAVHAGGRSIDAASSAIGCNHAMKG